jgi:hypothetical protein
MEADIMSNIDRQRITAVQVLEGLGYTFAGGEWKAPAGTATSLVPEADAMHGRLVQRTDDLAGCTAGSDEEQELESIVSVIEAYEAKRWPEGKVPGGKG